MSAQPPQSEGSAEPSRPLNILIVAGEASGDLHGANLVREMAKFAPHVKFFGVGGDLMEAAGVDLVYHMRNLAVVGITEVVRHLGDVRKALNLLTGAAQERHVDAVVLIDYPDFNLTLAGRLKKRLPDVPIVYYISPQVWAWRRGRVGKIARLVDRMLVILPFEKELYAATELDVDYVGHPLLDAVEIGGDRADFGAKHGAPPKDTWIGLLPGSRRAEVVRLLPPMLEAAESLLLRVGLPRFLIPVPPSLDDDIYNKILERFPDVAERAYLIRGDYYATLEHCTVAAICSGTATLEATLTDTPMVVVYRTSWLTYNLAKPLVKIPHIALVNLIAGRRAVPELVQDEVTGDQIADELRSLLNVHGSRGAALSALAEVRERLGEPGASERAARAVLQTADLLQRPSIGGSAP